MCKEKRDCHSFGFQPKESATMWRYVTHCRYSLRGAAKGREVWSSNPTEYQGLGWLIHRLHNTKESIQRVSSSRNSWRIAQNPKEYQMAWSTKMKGHPTLRKEVVALWLNKTSHNLKQIPDFRGPKVWQLKLQ